MKDPRLNLTLVAACWVLALVLPHYQTRPSAMDLFTDFIILCLVGLCSYRVLNSPLSKSSLLKLVFVVISIGGFVVGFIWSKLSDSNFYELWSHFGAGTLKTKQGVVFFGDLAHLTAAASCSQPVVVGTDVCDPWDRLFNQNPDVGELFRSLHLTDLNLIGFLVTFAFLAVFLYAIRFFNVETIGPYAVFLTPVFVLALDRGNEILTITLLASAILLLHRESGIQQFIGSGLLFSAVVLKLWPIFFIFFLLVSQWQRIKVTSRVLLLIPFIYLGFKFHEIKAIMKATQGGSPFGTSFGLRLFANPQVDLTQISLLMSITFVLSIMLIQLGRISLNEFLASYPRIKILRWALPLMLTYFAIWAIGDNFIYRMIILMPLVLILSSKGVFELGWSKLALSAILVTLITSRLPVTIAVSSALAFYFIYVTFRASLIGTSALRM